MKKKSKILGLLLTLAMLLNVLMPINVEAKGKAHWLMVESKTYTTFGGSSEKQVLTNEDKYTYNSKGERTKSIYARYDYDTYPEIKKTGSSKTVNTYKNDMLYKSVYDDGSYSIYTRSKDELKKVTNYSKDGKVTSTTTYTYKKKGNVYTEKSVTKEGSKVTGISETQVTYKKEVPTKIKHYRTDETGKRYLDYEVTYKNGFTSQWKSYNLDTKGKSYLSYDAKYDKKGMITSYTYYSLDEKGKAYASSESKYKYTYSKGNLKKSVETNSYTSYDGSKSTHTYTTNYYTSGDLSGQVKSTVYESKDSWGEYKETTTCSYKTDSHKNIVEKTVKNDEGKITDKYTYKYKKFTY